MAQQKLFRCDSKSADSIFENSTFIPKLSLHETNSLFNSLHCIML